MMSTLVSAPTTVTELLDQMTLAEKIGQMTQVEKNSLSPADVTTYHIGSVLSGGGGNPQPNTPTSWRDMVESFQRAALQTRLKIPLIYGVDAVHGHNNVHGAVIFPHNIGLGATRNPKLVTEIAHITAKEMLATGVHWNFAPMVAVPQDIRWGRTYEGFGQDTTLVSEMAQAYLRGLQNAAGSASLAHPHTALASVKHYLADGGTIWNTTPPYSWLDNNLWFSKDDRWSIDQGDTQVDEATLRAVHLPPYQAAIAAGARNIMVSYSSWQGLKLHAHRYLLTDVLKDELGFSGFLVSDWLALNQLGPDYREAVVTAINAGLDMVMVPHNFKTFISTLTEAVEAGDIAMSRIDDAVRRILQVKLELGLFDTPLTQASLLDDFGSPAHRKVARQAVRESLVLLKNQAEALPLPPQTSILLAGSAADDIGLQCGGWTIEWMGLSGNTTPGTSLYSALTEAGFTVTYAADGHFANKKQSELGIVVINEAPYAEGEGDRGDLTLSPAEMGLITRMRAQCQKLIVVLYAGRPLIITGVLDLSDAFVMAWLPGTEAQGIVDVLSGDSPFSGKLPCPWPRSMAQIPLSALENDTTEPLFPFGFSLTFE